MKWLSISFSLNMALTLALLGLFLSYLGGGISLELVFLGGLGSEGGLRGLFSMLLEGGLMGGFLDMFAKMLAGTLPDCILN